VIVAGGGRVGQYVARILSRLSTPFVVIEFDHARTQQIQAAGLPLIYGDAAQPPVLEAAGIDRAQLLLITTPTVVSAQSIVRSARARAPKVRIVARAESSDQMKVLHDMGVYEVVQPEFEAGLEITRQALLHLQIPASEIQRFTDAVRRELYAPLAQQSDAGRFIAALHDAARLLELRWLTVSASAPAAGQTIGALQIRSRYGASIVGLLRAGRLIPNPGADELLLGGDHVAVMGARAQTDAVAALLSSPEEAKAVQEGPAG
jgi:CPA2 family monovalent cation:H+ antiporter-2